MNHITDMQQLDFDAILRQRLPHHYKWIPRALIRMLERIICQEEMNEMLRVNAGRTGADFCRGVLAHLGITYTVAGIENLPPASDGRIIFVCNHPLGGLDGMMLIDWVESRYGSGVKFIVNDLLMAIKPLSGIFLPINKHGKQSRSASEAIEQTFAGNKPVIIFPAGLVSRKGADGRIADLEWNKMFISKSIRYNRTVIPLHFSGHNSAFFYNFAKLREKIGIKLNIEMIRLPKEVFLCRNRKFRITVGQPIPCNRFQGGHTLQEDARKVKEAVYALETSTNANL